MKFLAADCKEIAMFDRYLFDSFRSQPNSWLMNNYSVDRVKRAMKPAANHYDIQRYLCRVSDSQIGAGISFNFNWKLPYQIESMGFRPPMKYNSFEILNFYIREIPSRNPIKLLRAAMTLIDGFLDNTNYLNVYATCVPKLFNFYRFVGWQALDKIELDCNRFLFVIQYGASAYHKLEKCVS